MIRAVVMQMLIAGLVGLLGIKAASGQSISAYRSLELRLDTRMQALGGSHAVQLDPTLSSAWVNPALLAAVEGSFETLPFSSSISLYPAAIRQFQSSIAGERTLAGQAVRWSATVGCLCYGEMDKRDAAGQTIGSFRNYDMDGSLTVATRLSDQWRVGGSATMMVSSIGTATSSLVAFRAGVIWSSPTRPLQLGATVRNVGVAVTPYDEQREPLPFRASVGASYKPSDFPARLTLTTELQPRDGIVHDDASVITVLGGAEFLFSERLTFRLGYHHGEQQSLQTARRLDASGLRFGLGLGFQDSEVDITMASWGRLGSVIHLHYALPLKSLLPL
ncbi:MAG: PorV/PorQ family protein [Bacteroidetes bacterium]|nr:PorV/PorQ family protein [Bacteroidota bacterium]